MKSTVSIFAPKKDINPNQLSSKSTLLESGYKSWRFIEIHQFWPASPVVNMVANI